MVRGKNVGTPNADSRHFTTSSQKMDSFVSKIELVVGRHKGTHLGERGDHWRSEKGKPIPWTETILIKSHKSSSNTSDSWINSKQRIANCVSNWLTCVQDEESLWRLREAVSPYETAHLLVSSWPGPGDTRLFSVCKKLWGTHCCGLWDSSNGILPLRPLSPRVHLCAKTRVFVMAFSPVRPSVSFVQSEAKSRKTVSNNKQRVEKLQVTKKIRSRSKCQ
jgi:hypothetical protein